MPKAPFIFDPQARAKAAATRVKAAFAAAKSRTGNEGQLVAWSAGGLLLAFVLLAALAPLQMRAPAFVSILTGFVLFGIVVGATGVGAVALWRLIKGGAMDSAKATKPEVSIFNQNAIEAAFSDAEEAGLRGPLPRVVQDAMTGRLQGRPVAIMTADGVTFGVIRLATPAGVSLLITPDQSPWPFAFPKDSPLTPLSAPQGVTALAWSTHRDTGAELIGKLGPALVMSQAGGCVPFVSVRGRALVMMWPLGDVGTASVIMGDVARALDG